MGLQNAAGWGTVASVPVLSGDSGDSDPPGSNGSGEPGAWSDADRLLRYMGHAVVVTDLAGRVIGWNPAAERLFGWTAAEVLGRNIIEVTVPEAGRGPGAEILQDLRQGRTWSGGFTVRRKDGSTFPALVTGTGLYDDDEQLVGIVGVSTDLGHALRPLMEHSSDAALVLTRAGLVSYVSPATARLFGWSEATALGHHLWELVHPDDRRLALEHHQRVSGYGAQLPPWECRLRCFGDAWRWVEVLMTDLLADPAVSGVVCNLRDVTERRESQARLVELTEQLQTALSSRLVIEQAKGMIAVHRGIGVDEAFRVLRKHARDHNANLHDVATAVVTLGLRP
jgi:PAS domain S-box-containing protein